MSDDTPENQSIPEPKPEKLLRPLRKVRRKSTVVKKRKLSPAKKQAAAERMLGNRLVTLTLQRIHRINGIAYGPGVIKVPANIATGILETEQHIGKQEDKFHGTRGVIIGRANKLIEVPIENFNTELTTADPFSQVSGKGMKDPGPQAT